MSARLTNTRVSALILSLALVCGTSASAQDKPQSQRILECLVANQPTRLMVDPLVTRVQDRAGGITEYRWRLYARERDDAHQLVLQLTAPDDVAGTAYLVHRTESERRIYVRSPAVGGVRRIEGVSGSGPTILGTELTINEVAGMAAKVREHAFTVLGEDSVHGRTTDRLVATPPPSAGAAYSRLTAFVTRDPCVVLRVEVSRNTTPIKIYDTDPGSLRQLDSGAWYASQWTIRDVRASTTTTIRFENVDDSPQFAEGRFEPESFFR